MKYFFSWLLVIMGVGYARSEGNLPKERFFPADNRYIQYMGRVDFSNPKMPRCWAAGATIRMTVRGGHCRILLRDQVPDDKTHNYVGIVIGNSLCYRIKLHGREDTLRINRDGSISVDDSMVQRYTDEEGNRIPGYKSPDIATDDGTASANHDYLVTICKDTESGNGWLSLGGVFAEALLPPPALPVRKIECIGNSITTGTGMDLSEIPCGQGEWYEQHNAWMSYGARTARALNAQWHLTAVAGIGLIHSCCKLNITMPQVFDKMNGRADSVAWDFSRYQPDVVTVTLGQNDGIQDSVVFTQAYVDFIRQIRGRYATAQIVCLTSPMGGEKLTAALKNYLAGIVAFCRNHGDAGVSSYFYSKQYHHGCGGHPDLAEHREIAAELTAYLKKLMNW